MRIETDAADRPIFAAMASWDAPLLRMRTAIAKSSSVQYRVGGLTGAHASLVALNTQSMDDRGTSASIHHADPKSLWCSGSLWRLVSSNRNR